MKSKLGMWVFMAALGIGGLALAITLLMKHGIRDVIEGVAAVRWRILAMFAAHLFTMWCDTMTWQALIPKQHRMSLARLYFIHWIGESVSAMLPVAQVGGEIVRVRLAAARGMPVGIAAASVLVGMTLSVGTQIVFTLSGLLVMMIVAGGHSGGMAWTIVVGALIGVGAVGGFYAVQRLGMFRIIAAIGGYVMKGDAWKGVLNRGASLDEEVRAMYGRRSAVLASAGWYMACWAAGALEVWVALWALGIHTGYGQAYALEAMGQGVRSAAFLIPGALGVQEGSYMVVGKLVGLTAETGLALALLRRVRELAFGLPGIMAWQWAEGRLWLARGTHSVPAKGPSPGEAVQGGG